jgi:HAD superfamily hydrolase (TIGR01509 family)
VAELRAVIFDMDGTVLVWTDPTVNLEQMAMVQFGEVHRLLVGRGYAPPNESEFSPAFLAKAGLNWRAAMRVCQSYTVYDLLAEALPEMGLNVSKGDLADCVAAFESIPDPTGPKGDALATLEVLRDRGLKLGLISNSWSTPAYRDNELRQAGLLDLLPVRVYSSTMDVMKPHPAIFQRALSELDVPASQAVMVGDMLSMDIGGAQAAGMRGVWLDNSGRGLPDDAPVQPDACIRRLSEIIEVLDCWMGS